MKKLILLVVVLMLVVSSYNVSAWDPNPLYNPFEVIWNYLANVSTSWKDGSGKVTTNVSVGIGTDSPGAKLDVEVSSGGAATIGSNLNSATGDYAVAMGRDTTASGVASTAMGRFTTASGYYSTAMGNRIEAAGLHSVGIGLDDTSRTITQDNTMAIMGGNVGIGTTSPGAELDVEGDLYVTGAYRGEIGPNNGAPSPRPAYDSGWQSVTPGHSLALTHNIGGNASNYVVDMQFKDDGSYGVNNMYYGGYYGGGYFRGVFWSGLTSSTIWVTRLSDDIYADKFRVRIWVYN